MADITSYPQASPHSTDLVLGSKQNALGKWHTKTFTVASLFSGIPSNINGTVNYVPLFTTANTIGDSLISQKTPLKQISIDGQLKINNDVTSQTLTLVSNLGPGSVSNYIQAEENDGTRQWVLGADPSGDFVLAQEKAGGDILITNTTGNLITGTAAGNVGIKNANPQRELDVDGGVRVRGPLDLFQSNDNTLAGQDAGNFYNINGSKNTAFGKNSQKVQVSGSQNTSVGYNSMAEATVGNLNVAVGDSAMASNDGGSFNTAVGALALQDQEAGQGNTAIGYQSLNNKEASNFNSALGFKSLFNISTGFKNIGIGDNAGLALSTGARNILIGSDADVAASSNNNSIVIGESAVGAGSNTVTLGNNNITNTYLKGDVTVAGAINVSGTLANPSVFNVGGSSSDNVVNFLGSASFAPNAILRFGNLNAGLSIYQDDVVTGDSIISDNGPGNLRISGKSQIQFRNQLNGELYAVFNENSAVNLYYDNVVKFETTANGIEVTGTQSSFSGQVTIPVTPVAGTDATSKQYVDSITDDTAEKLAIVSGTLFATWGGSVKPYFNFISGSSTIVPYDTIVVNNDVYGNSPFTYNNTSNTDSSFQVEADGVYEVSINAHFYDQFGDIDIYGALYNNSTNALIIGLLDQKDVTGNTDSNWHASTIVELDALTNYDIRLLFSGGSGQSPYPSNSGSILNSLTIKRLS